MMEDCNRHIERSLTLAAELRSLADEGEGESRDDGCVLLYGVIRDCSYRIRVQAEKELAVHRALREWDRSLPEVLPCPGASNMPGQAEGKQGAKEGSQ
jgi:hypothetical protein